MIPATVSGSAYHELAYTPVMGPKLPGSACLKIGQTLGLQKAKVILQRCQYAGHFANGPDIKCEFAKRLGFWIFCKSDW